MNTKVIRIQYLLAGKLARFSEFTGVVRGSGKCYGERLLAAVSWLVLFSRTWT